MMHDLKPIASLKAQILQQCKVVQDEECLKQRQMHNVIPGVFPFEE